MDDDAEIVEESEEPEEVAEGSLVESREDPDVLLDVPILKVDEIDLDVEDLRARVSLQAEVLDLLKLNVGVDVVLGRVKLDITGVEAQALLKVRLDNVVTVVSRVLETIDRNPEILEHVTSSVGSAVRDVGRGTGEAVGELGRGASDAVEEVGAGTGRSVEDIGAGAGRATEDVGAGAGKAAGNVGAGAGKAVADVGEGAGEVAVDAGETVKGVNEGAEDAVAEEAGDVAGDASRKVDAQARGIAKRGARRGAKAPRRPTVASRRRASLMRGKAK